MVLIESGPPKFRLGSNERSGPIRGSPPDEESLRVARALLKRWASGFRTPLDLRQNDEGL